MHIRTAQNSAKQQENFQNRLMGITSQLIEADKEASREQTQIQKDRIKALEVLDHHLGESVKRIADYGSESIRKLELSQQQSMRDLQTEAAAYETVQRLKLASTIKKAQASSTAKKRRPASAAGDIAVDEQADDSSSPITSRQLHGTFHEGHQGTTIQQAEIKKKVR
jgi:hypothetical protein